MRTVGYQGRSPTVPRPQGLQKTKTGHRGSSRIDRGVIRHVIGWPHSCSEILLGLNAACSADLRLPTRRMDQLLSPSWTRLRAAQWCRYMTPRLTFGIGWSSSGGSKIPHWFQGRVDAHCVLAPTLRHGGTAMFHEDNVLRIWPKKVDPMFNKMWFRILSHFISMGAGVKALKPPIPH